MKVELIAISKPDVGAITLGGFIAYVARVSNPGNQSNTETAPKLLKYLQRQNHWSPFEMASMCLGIETTRDIARQILRHRSFSFQEFSQRYAVVTDESIIREARLQDVKNRQNSLELDDPVITKWWTDAQETVAELSRNAYNKALERGIAKEVARAVLPEGLTPSTLYMSGTIRSWIHYIQMRDTAHTQKEHRLIAAECKRILIDQIPELEESFQ